MESLQNLEVLYTSGENGISPAGQVLGKLPALQVLWRTFFPALENPEIHDKLIEAATRRANAELEPMIYKN